MKLQIVPAKVGVSWAILGIKTFFRQPLALIGLFALSAMALAVLNFIPILGVILAFVLIPGFTLGFMASSMQISQGQFPMPWTMLLSAYDGAPAQRRDMLVLGAIYAACMLLALAISALFDGGQFAKLYMGNGDITNEAMNSSQFPIASMVFMLCLLPISMAFWHAPALVGWHQLSPVKALFFSLIACVRNFRAFWMYGLTLFGLLFGLVFVGSLVMQISNNTDIIGIIMLPITLLLMVCILASTYFTFRDCFAVNADDANGADGTKVIEIT